MTITVRTPRAQLQPGDKVLIKGYKKPLTVVVVAGIQAKLRTANGYGIGVIQKDFVRVVTKLSEVIR